METWAMLESLLNDRRALADRYQAALFDWSTVSLCCTRCDARSMSSFFVILDVDYDSMESLEAHAGNLVPRLLEHLDGPRCARCEAETFVDRLYLLTYHAPESRDLVVAHAPESEEHPFESATCSFWHPDSGFEPVERFSPGQAQGFELSALVRRAAVEEMAAQPDDEAVVEHGIRALDRAPGHPLLLEILEKLIDWGRTQLAGAIARAHIDLHPEDPQGHYWLGEVIFKMVNHGARDREALDEAIHHLSVAIELDPGLTSPRNSLGNCLRLLGKNHQARLWYIDLIEEDAGCPEARFNLGIMDLEAGDAESALAHFEEGEKVELEDADFPVGRARALLALGQVEEAAEALERVRELNPDHPRLESLEAQLIGPN
ncbi:MAG: tetratricopeptide repeat protein [Acidobacteriota bacterium]